MVSRFQIFTVLFFIVVGLQGQETKKKPKNAFKASLLISTDFSYALKSDKLQKSEIILKPEFSYKLNRNSKFILKGLLYSELNDNLEAGIPKEETVSNFSKRLFIGNRTHLELREFYFYTNIRKKLRLTLGKQQIVWGETDGLKLLDIVNPQNFREFILDDFEDSRIPLWSLKAEFDINSIGIQLVWIPDNTYHITQDFDAPFFTKSLFRSPPEGISTVLNSAVKPKHFIEDSDIGFKLSTFNKGWDISLNYLYYYDDLPVFYNNIDLSENNTPVLSINSKFERQHLLGGTFNKVFGSSTFRGEIAYVFNQNFTSTSPKAILGIETSNQFKSAIGIDYIKGENIISAQIFSDIITDNLSPYNRAKLETNTSLKVSREMMNDNLNTEILWVHNSNHGDGYIKPLINFWMNSNTQVQIGGSLFYGNKAKLFGQFNNQNRISFGMKIGI